MMSMEDAIEFAVKIAHKECRRRGIAYDEDVAQEAALKAVMAVKMFDESRGAPFSSYLWKAVYNMLNRWSEVRNCDLLNVSIFQENEDEEEYVLAIPAQNDRNFNDELMGVLLRYQGKIGKDFCKLVLGHVDVPNVLKSIANSKRRGEKWIEGWLGRRLSKEERACCMEIKMILREV
jgi:hypothetical protein